MKFSPIDHLALQLGLCSVATNGFVVRPTAPITNVRRRGGQMPRRSSSTAHAETLRRRALMMTSGGENNDGLDLDAFSTPQELSDTVSDQTLQNALDNIGLKSDDGASPLDKAKLLFLTKYLPLEDIPEKYWAGPKGGKEVGGSAVTDTSIAPTIAPTVDLVNTTSTSDVSAEIESDEKKPLNATTNETPSIDVDNTDMTAEDDNTGKNNASEDKTPVETSASTNTISIANDTTDGDASGQDDDIDGLDLDLDLYDSYQELCEACDDDVLRAELQRIGLKSDGKSMDMAKRLFITKYFPIDEIPEEYLEESSGAADAKGSGTSQEEPVFEASEEDTKLVTEAIVNDDSDSDDDDEVMRLEEEQRLLEMELEAVEARIGETAKADQMASNSESADVNEVAEKDKEPVKEPEATKISKANDLPEEQSQTDVPDFPTASDNVQAAATVKEQTERQRLEVERIKAQRIAAEEEAAAIRREKERIAAQEELEFEEQEEDERSEINVEETEDIVEEDDNINENEDVVLGDVSEPLETEQDQKRPEKREKSEEMSNPFDSKAPGTGLPPSSTLASSNPFIAGMPPSSTLPSSNPFVAGPSKEKLSEDDAPSEDEESNSKLFSSPAFSSSNPFIDPPSQESANKEMTSNSVESEQAEVDTFDKEQKPKEDVFRFEADRIKAEQEAKRQKLARERLEAEALANQSKDVDTDEKSSEPSILSRVASAAVGAIGLGVLAAGGSFLLDGIDTGNEIQSVPSISSPPIAEVLSSADTSISVPDASTGESSRFSSEKVEDSSKSSATDFPLAEESGDTPAGDSLPLSAPEAEAKPETESPKADFNNEDTMAATSISAGEEQSKDDLPAAESFSPASSVSETTPEPEAVTTDIEKRDDDTSSTAAEFTNSSEEPSIPSPPPPTPPVPPVPPKLQQQEPTTLAEIMTSKPETVEKSDSVATKSQKTENTASIVETTGKVSSNDFPSLSLPTITAPSINRIFPSVEKIKQPVSDIEFSDGAKIAGVASVAALGAIGAAMQGQGEVTPGKNNDGEDIKIEDTESVLKETNSTAFELPTPPRATNKTAAPMPFSAKNMTAQKAILNATGVAKAVNGSSTNFPFDSSKSPVPSSNRPVSPGDMKDRTEKKPPASIFPPPQAFVASSPGPKRVTKPIDAEIISSEKDTDSDSSLQKVLDEASEAVADAEAALAKNTTDTRSNSTISKKMDNIESEEDKRIAAEFKAAKEKMETEKMERIEKAKSAEAQFLDQERKEAAEKAKQKRAEAEKRIADARNTIQLEQSRDQKAAVSSPNEKSSASAPSGVSATPNGAKAVTPSATKPPIAMSSPTGDSPRPSAAEAMPRPSGDNWFNEQLRRQQIEERAGPSPFERSRKLADGTEIPPDPAAAYKSSSYYGTNNVDAADGVLSTGEYAKSAFLAAFVGIWAAFPILGLHYLVFSDYTYTTFAQWEWELIAASVQSSCFGIIYRYALRSDVDNSSLQRIVVLAAVLLKSVIRVNVPYVCAAGDLAGGLFCADSPPFFVLNDSMTTDLFLNGLEGLAMFTAVAVSMNWLTERRRR